MKCACIITVLSVLSAAGLATSHDSPKIGIVGAGISGLYTALKLYDEYGITNIDFYERESAASISIESVDTDGDFGYIDIATVFAPPYYNDSDIPFGISEEYQHLLDRYPDISRKSLPLISGIYSDTQSYIPLSSFLQNGIITDFNALIEETLKMLLLFEELNGKEFTEISDYHNNDYTVKGETFTEWGIRNNMTNVVYFTISMSELATGINSWLQYTAAYCLHYNLKWRVPHYIDLLRELGLTSTVTQSMGNEYLLITKIMRYHEERNGPSWTLIQPSYQHLFDNVVNELVENGVNIKFNTNVVAVKKHNKNKLKIVYQPQNCKLELLETAIYDFVFITIRQNDLLQLLDDNDFSVRYNLYSEYTMISTMQGTLFGDIANIEQPPFWMSDGGFYGYPQWFSVATQQLVDLYDDCTPMFHWMLNDQQTIYSFGFGPYYYGKESINSFNANLLNNQCVNKTITHFNDAYNYQVNEDNIDKTWLWSFGSTVTAEGEENNFYQIINEMQGEHGLFIIGETVAGFTVPNNIQYVESHYRTFYHIMFGDFY